MMGVCTMTGGGGERGDPPAALVAVMFYYGKGRGWGGARLLCFMIIFLQETEWGEMGVIYDGVPAAVHAWRGDGCRLN